MWDPWVGLDSVPLTLLQWGVQGLERGGCLCVRPGSKSAVVCVWKVAVAWARVACASAGLCESFSLSPNISHALVTNQNSRHLTTMQPKHVRYNKKVLWFLHLSNMTYFKNQWLVYLKNSMYYRFSTLSIQTCEKYLWLLIKPYFFYSRAPLEGMIGNKFQMVLSPLIILIITTWSACILVACDYLKNVFIKKQMILLFKM